MTVKEVLSELEAMGSPAIKKVLMNHGAREPFFGTKVEDQKKIQKKIKKDYQLSLDLYKTGISDAMYLAGLIADEKKMTKEDLRTWADGAYWYMLSEYTVPWVAAESPFGWELGLEWIESNDEKIASAGWSTLSNWIALKPDSELDLDVLSAFLDLIQEKIHSSQNRVKYTMNVFVISVGAYVNPLSKKAIETGLHIGKVQVDLGGTACKVPLAPEYIEKCIARGTLTKKKKTVRC